MATRRMGALDFKPGNPLVQIAAVGIGYFLAADPVNTEIDKLLTKTAADGTKTPPTASTKKMVGGATAGAGAALVLMGKKTMVKTLAGGALAGVGLKRLLKEFNVISGFQDVPVLGRRNMAGFQDVPVLGKLGDGIGAYAVNGEGINGSRFDRGYAVTGNGKMAMQ